MKTCQKTYSYLKHLLQHSNPAVVVCYFPPLEKWKVQNCVCVCVCDVVIKKACDT